MIGTSWTSGKLGTSMPGHVGFDELLNLGCSLAEAQSLLGFSLPPNVSMCFALKHLPRFAQRECIALDSVAIKHSFSKKLFLNLADDLSI